MNTRERLERFQELVKSGKVDEARAFVAESNDKRFISLIVLRDTVLKELSTLCTKK